MDTVVFGFGEIAPLARLRELFVALFDLTFIEVVGAFVSLLFQFVSPVHCEGLSAADLALPREFRRLLNGVGAEDLFVCGGLKGGLLVAHLLGKVAHSHEL